MKSEGSPSEVGPAFTSDALSGDPHGDDHFSDDEPENEVEALQHLPPDERRKALRRLRNRESARRVRARRLAEMSHMETAVHGMQDENVTLKAHVSKLQAHIQSMTMKVYEITAKYESAVAENAQLRTELHRLRRPSMPGDSSFLTAASNVAAVAAAAANGPNSAPPQLSPFVSPGFDKGANQVINSGLAQLRSSSPMDLQQQRHALEDVVMLLKQHKRRSQLAAQDRSAGSEMGSSGVGTKATSSLTHARSPVSDPTLPGAVPMFGHAGFDGGNNNNSSNSSLPYNVGGMGGGCTIEGSTLGGGRGRGGAAEVSVGHMMQQMQHHGHGQSACNDTAMCHLSMSTAHNTSQMPPLSQLQQLQQLMPNPASASAMSMSLNNHTQQQQQLMQSHSQPLMQLQQLPQHHLYAQPAPQQVLQSGCQQQVATGSSGLFSTISALSGPFYSAASAMPCGISVMQLQPHTSGPNVVGGLCGPLGAPQAGGLGVSHRSASYALDRGNCAALQNVVAMHPTWQGNCNNGAAGVASLRPEDIAEDLFMSLDEYVPQDL